MSGNEHALQEAFDNDPTNPQLAIALALYEIARAIRDTCIRDEVEFVGTKLTNLENLSDIAGAIEDIRNDQGQS